MCNITLPFFLCYCSNQPDKAKSGIHFTSLSSGKTGITFNNTITENDSVNLLENEYTYIETLFRFHLLQVVLF